MAQIVAWIQSHQIATAAGLIFVALLVRANWGMISGAAGKLFTAHSPDVGRSSSSDQTSQRSQLGFDPNLKQIVTVEFDMSVDDQARIYFATRELIANCPDRAIKIIEQSQSTAGDHPAN